jgi:drug/metabolite transporter (DMT)-like permease
LNFLETEDSRSRAALALAIVSVSTAAIMIRMCESGPLTVAFYRLLFTTLMVMPWALARDMDCFKGLGWKDWAKLAGIGLVLAAHFALWVSAVGMTSIANSAVLVTMHPIFVAAISVALLKESPPRSALLGAGIAFVGVAIMFAGGLSGGGLAGDVLAIGGAVAAGLYIIGGRSQRKRLRTGAYCLAVYGFATIFIAPLAFLESGFVPASGNDWYVFLAMAVVAGVLGHTMYNYALGRVSAFLVSTTLLGEPIISSILAWVLLSEIPSNWTFIGAPLVLGGILLASGLLSNFKKPKPAATDKGIA